MAKTTWNKLIAKTNRFFEIDEPIIYSTANDKMDDEFDDESEEFEGVPFIAWSQRYIYFPAYSSRKKKSYVNCAPRNPYLDSMPIIEQ